MKIKTMKKRKGRPIIGGILSSNLYLGKRLWMKRAWVFKLQESHMFYVEFYVKD